MPFGRRMIREMTDEQVRKFFKKNFFDCMKDVEYGPKVVLANNEAEHPETRYPSCDLNNNIYAYPNRPWIEEDDDEPEQEDIMIICSQQYDDVTQALKRWFACMEKHWAIHESEMIIGTETEDSRRARY